MLWHNNFRFEYDLIFREFWRYDPENTLKEFHYESDEDSEAELKALFIEDEQSNENSKIILSKPRVETRNIESKEEQNKKNNNQNNRNPTPEFLVEMKKRQMARAEKREEIRKGMY